MRRIASAGYALLGIAIVVLSVYATVQIVVAAVRTFQGLDKQVAAALVAGFASVTVATVSVVGGRYLERRAQAEFALREKKSAIYERFLRGMFDVFDIGHTSTESEEDKAARIVAFLAELTPELVAWASDDVVAAWSRTKRGASQVDASPIASLFEFENLLRAIRHDLGHRGRKLRKGDLLGLFVTDVDRYVND